MTGPFDYFSTDRPTPVRWQGSKETLPSGERSQTLLSKGDELGHFIVDDLLGYGSSGFVFRVFDKETHQRYALKVLRQQNQDDVLQNRYGFRRMMSISHPNLANVDRIYQFGEHTCLAMEEVRGVTFAREMRKILKLPKQQAFETLSSLLRDYATGLAVMHASGLVHRDIKPHNLMVDENGRGKIIDFGLVDHFEVDPKLEMDGWIVGIRPGNRVGMPRYYSPEVIWSQRYLPSGDVFALGMVFTEAVHMVAGEESESDPATNPANDQADSGSTGMLASLGKLTQQVPQQLHEFCVSMIDRHPEERPTAMRVARLGMSPGQVVDWPHEDVLVGRSREMEQIQNWVDDVFNGKVSRLHISGMSGIGKTRLVEEAIRYIDSKRWGQVFFGRCRAREDAPMQAFMQICDLIAHRYGRPDRDPIELDYVSANIICRCFPVMSTIVKPIMKSDISIRVDDQDRRLRFDQEYDQQPNDNPNREPSRYEALKSAVAICDRLRDLGPLFLIVDDTQWADRDSLNVLDHIRTATDSVNGLGILTLSRTQEQRQRIPADYWIKLEQLSVPHGIRVLRLAADRQGLEIDPEELRQLAIATDGNPFRLQEVAEEFCPGGLLADPIHRSSFLRDVDTSSDDTKDPTLAPEPANQRPQPSDSNGHAGSPRSIDEFWRRRAGAMGNDARRLLPLVAAGGKVSTVQLAELSGLGIGVDAVISQLSRGRLIVDEATGGECISIYHDHVADQLIAGLSEAEKRQAHLDWANLLIKQDDPSNAARIAGHLFAADRPTQAVHFAILAAEKADLLVAKTESARWYRKAASHTTGDEQIHLLRLAAKAYYEADQPSLAAETYSELAQRLQGEERRECQESSVILNIQSGHFGRVQKQLQQLSRQMRLPHPKSAAATYLPLAINVARLKWLQRSEPKDDSFASIAQRFGIGHPTPTDDTLTPSELQDRIRLNFCNQLARPLSMFYSLYAAELNVTAARLVKKLGTDDQRIHIAVGECIFGCYDAGSKREHGEAKLRSLQQHASELGSELSRGNVFAGMVCSHAMSCRWSEVEAPMKRAMEAYGKVKQRHSFEIAHTHWVGLWADWNLGRWSNMVAESEFMIDDSIRRNDLFQQMATWGGYGAGAFLAKDQVAQLRRFCSLDRGSNWVSGQAECFDLLNQMTFVQLFLYEGNYEAAWRASERLEKSVHRFPMQFFRVIQKSLSVLAGLHKMRADKSLTWDAEVAARSKQLRSEGLPLAIAFADFYDAIRMVLACNGAVDEKSNTRIQQKLSFAVQAARLQKLEPLRLAASDLIHQLSGETCGCGLEDAMEKQAVVAPQKLARLYTVDLKPIR